MKAARLSAAACACMFCAAGAAWSQTYPAKLVRVIVPFPPGGANDIVSRIVLPRVSEQMGQSFVIENRSGAGGTIGSAVVAQSKPDGYTLLIQTVASHVSNGHLYSKLPYDPLRDFAGVSPLARVVSVLTVHPSMPVRTVRDLVALAKKRPGEISYGTAGVGAFQHLATSLLANMAGIDIVHVPYKGGGPASVATAGGEVQMILTPISEVLPHLKAKRIRPIAVSSDERTKQFPDIPTIAETVKGYEFTSWMGTFAPAGTPRAIVEKLNAELKKAVAAPEVANNLSSQSLDPMYMTLDQFAKQMRADYDKYAHIVKISGAKLQ